MKAEKIKRNYKQVLGYLLCVIHISAPLSFSVAQSFRDLEKLKTQYKEALEKQTLQKPSDIHEAEKTAQSTALPDKLVYSRKDIESLLVNTENLLERLAFLEDSIEVMPYIGYDIFTKRDTMPFWQNIPTPKNYNLGPGDEIIIAVWGEAESYETQTINRDGQIFIEKIGVVSLSGKSLERAKRYLLTRYSKVYSTLAGKNPTSFLDITLGEMKSVNVHFVGYVNIPGVHMVHPFSNVISGLSQAGGVDITGSLRDIQIIRNGEPIGSFDIYSYFLKGHFPPDGRLMDQDVVYVPPRHSTLAITGRVKKPGYYEGKTGESLQQVFSFSGGLDAKSSENIFLYRQKEDALTSPLARLISKNDLDLFNIQDGDSLYIPVKTDQPLSITIKGQVKRPGEYPYEKNITLLELIEATGSLGDSDFIQTMDLNRVSVYRRNSDGTAPQTFLFDLSGLDRSSSHNIILHNFDQISIPRGKKFKPIESVQITGEVHHPGIYPVNELGTLKKVIQQAGGLTPQALDSGISIFRDSLQIAWESMAFPLQKGDSLHVSKKSGVVTVLGEVNNPGYITYKKGKNIKEYIRSAGGYSAYANPGDVVVIHPNGIAIPKRRFFSPKVIEGSTIMVYQQSLLESANKTTGWDAFIQVSGQATSVVTTILTLILLSKQTGTGG